MSKFIRIGIADKNDNPPYFDKGLYEAEVRVLFICLSNFIFIIYPIRYLSSVYPSSIRSDIYHLFIIYPIRYLSSFYHLSDQISIIFLSSIRSDIYNLFIIYPIRYLSSFIIYLLYQ